MSGQHIQLLFGIVRDKSKEKSIKLNLPPNFRKDVLFDQLPYLAHLENPTIVDVVKNGVVDNLSLQSYLLVTGLLKDSIQDSLDMIISSDGILSDAAVRRQLDTKFPSAMRKPNPIDAVFKDKAKFDTRNPIIGTPLTQVELGKINNEKQIKKQLKAAPSIKNLKIAEQLKRLRDFNRKRVDDYSDDDDNKDDDDNGFGPPASLPPAPPFGLPLYNPPSPLISKDDNEIAKDLTPAQKFLLGDTAKAPPFAAREKVAVAVAEKIGFSENLSELFPKADVVFENNNQKLFADAEPLSRPEMTTIPHTQVMFKELNEGKLSNQLKFTSSGNSRGSSKLKICTMGKIGTLNESNNAFLVYLTTGYTHEILAKNKIKIHLETGNIYYNNINMQKSI